jgi:hypothetical protein
MCLCLWQTKTQTQTQTQTQTRTHKHHTHTHTHAYIYIIHTHPRQIGINIKLCPTATLQSCPVSFNSKIRFSSVCLCEWVCARCLCCERERVVCMYIYANMTNLFFCSPNTTMNCETQKNCLPLLFGLHGSILELLHRRLQRPLRVYAYICIYVHICGERDRARSGEREKICMYKYIHTNIHTYI